MKFCKTCNVEYNDNIRFCPVCGDRLSVGGEIEQITPEAKNIFEGVGDKLNQLIEDDPLDFLTSVDVKSDDSLLLEENKDSIESETELESEIKSDFEIIKENSRRGSRRRKNRRRKKDYYSSRRNEEILPQPDDDESVEEDGIDEAYIDQSIDDIADDLEDLSVYRRISDDNEENFGKRDDLQDDNELHGMTAITDLPEDDAEGFAVGFDDNTDYDDEPEDYEDDRRYSEYERENDYYDSNYEDDYEWEDDDPEDDKYLRDESYQIRSRDIKGSAGQRRNGRRRSSGKSYRYTEEPLEDEDYLRPLYENAHRGRSPLSKFATVLVILAFFAVIGFGGYKLWNMFDTGDQPSKATVSFTIRSSKEDKPLSGVTVKLLKKQSDAQYHSEYYIDYAEAETDSLGVFEVEAGRGEYKVEVDSPEYSQKEIYVTVTKELDVQITQNNIK